jgi:hypothetical protein
MFKSRFLQRRAYGWDQAGEVLDNQQVNIEDTQNPETTKHETPVNPTNHSVDSEAERDFPWITRRPNRIPSRNKL